MLEKSSIEFWGSAFQALGLISSRNRRLPNHCVIKVDGFAGKLYLVHAVFCSEFSLDVSPQRAQSRTNVLDLLLFMGKDQIYHPYDALLSFCTFYAFIHHLSDQRKF